MQFIRTLNAKNKIFLMMGLMTYNVTSNRTTIYQLAATTVLAI